ncbi:hypothetical protein VB738_13120 [Cyanobium gracile UHCC 0139]|uniref:DUF378 domain-containing protein n=1 Tax=Cyanobium gracile UHCC 0139 TaxID=3110308 RepID=A0ABU5RWP6_9CYAN|nr:hypothetical protein [Cyanobium gracile]MEA5392200.1 hypothetical protein [Cyanobium gracile UHCC 0139]
MKEQATAVALVALWVLGWGVGGSLIDAGLIGAGVYDLDGGQTGTLLTFLLWSLLWGGFGLKLWRRRVAGGSDAGREDNGSSGT